MWSAARAWLAKLIEHHVSEHQQKDNVTALETNGRDRLSIVVNLDIDSHKIIEHPNRWTLMEVPEPFPIPFPFTIFIFRRRNIIIDAFVGKSRSSRIDSSSSMWNIEHIGLTT
jgi:hypothetical protein